MLTATSRMDRMFKGVVDKFEPHLRGVEQRVEEMSVVDLTLSERA